MVEEVEDLTEVVDSEAADSEVAEDLDGVAVEVVLIGNKITVHQNMLSVSSRVLESGMCQTTSLRFSLFR